MLTSELGSGRYDVIREIGRGGMGAVYEVHDRVRDVRVALKTVTRLEPHRIVELKREFRAVAELRHQNLIQLYELHAEDRSCFFTMELVSGQDLRTWIRADGSEIAHADTCAASETPATASEPRAALDDAPPVAQPPPSARSLSFDPDRLRDVLAQLADGLAFLHESGTVHRDIKPSNALVTTGGKVVLLDFGLAAEWRPRARRTPSNTPPFAGTVAYMAPEYVHGQVVSPAMDLYALGVVTYEVVTGAAPFEGSLYEVVNAHMESTPAPLRSINPKVPADLDELVGELLAKDPAARPSAAEVRARALGEARPAPPRRRARPRFVGRSAELRALEGALDRARAGTPRLALIEGTSGSGKSTLTEEFLYRAAGADVVAFRGRCYQREKVPYRAFDQIVEDLVLEAGLEDQAEVPRHLPALARVFPVFTELTGPAPKVEGDPRDERERAFEALADLLSANIAGRVGVLVVDDLQWADSGSLELLSVLCERSGDLPLLIVATLRTEDRDAVAALADFLDRMRSRRCVDAIPLGPLAASEVRDLVSSVVVGPVGDHTLEAICAASGGRPYAVEAIAGEIAILGRRPDAAELDVGALEAARIARLDEDERLALRAASAAGGAATFAELREVSALPPPRLLSAVHGLESARLLRAAPTGAGDVAYDFYHERLRDITYDRLDEVERRELHRRFAEAYESGAGARAHERRAHHWELAGRPQRAAAAAFAAADESLAQLAFERSAELYGQALRLGLSGGDAEAARECRAEAVLLSSDFARAAELCRELAGDRTGIARERWLLRCAEAEIKLGELESGITTLEEVLRPRKLRFRKTSASTLASAARVSVRVLVPWKGRRRRPAPAGEDAELLSEIYRVVANFLSTPYPREAWEFVLRSIDHARRRGDAGREACGLAMVSGYLESASLGRFSSGRYLRRAREIAEGCRDPYALLVVEAVSALQCTTAGAWAEMREHAAEGHAICRDIGMQRSWEASFLHSYNGLGEICAGEADAAISILGDYLDSRRTPDLFTRAMASTFYARALLLAGRFDEAAEVARELEDSQLSLTGSAAMWTGLLRGELALSRGEFAGAAAAAEEMRRTASGAGLRFLPYYNALRHALAATAYVGLGSARSALEHAERLLRTARGTFYEVTARRLVAQAHAAAGDAERSAAALERAAIAGEQRGGRVEREAIAALSGAIDRPRSPAVSWITAGAVPDRD